MALDMCNLKASWNKPPLVIRTRTSRVNAFARHKGTTEGHISMLMTHDTTRAKLDIVWWPTRTAFDRQEIKVGTPFERKGEILVVERKPSGALYSRCIGSSTKH